MHADAPDLSVCDCDQYLTHLAHISAHRNLVASTADIYNQFGVLLIRSGTPLGSFATDKLRNHRLNAPVDTLLSLQRRLQVGDIVNRFNELLGSEADLAAVARCYQSEDSLRHFCYQGDLPAVLLQRLTVLELTMPRVFHRALFTAWLASLVAQEQGLDTESVRLAMLAGLCHDFGLLHIPPQLVDKKRDIQPEEWRAIQRHVVYSALLVESIEGLPGRLARIVLQHHERCDGAGYPTGKNGEALDPIGQIIAMVNMIHTLRFQRLLLSSQSSLHDSMAFLRVNTRTFGEVNYQAISRVLANAGSASPKGASADGLPTSQDLLAANRSIQAVLEQLTLASDVLESLPAATGLDSVRSLAQQVQWVSLTSGIGNDVFEFLINNQGQKVEHIQELRDTVITIREVVWLIRRIDRQLQELAADKSGGFSDTELPEIAAVIRKHLDNAWRVLDMQADTAKS